MGETRIMYDVLVKNGKIVTADSVTDGNIAIKDGKIAAVLASGVEPEAAEVIDAKENYVFPGAIDTHAHLNDPGYEWREDYEHGTAAAAVGHKAYVDYCFWGGLVPDNFDDLEGLKEKGCVAFKPFIGPVSPDYSSLSCGDGSHRRHH